MPGLWDIGLLALTTAGAARGEAVRLIVARLWAGNTAGGWPANSSEGCRPSDTALSLLLRGHVLNVGHDRLQLHQQTLDLLCRDIDRKVAMDHCIA